VSRFALVAWACAVSWWVLKRVPPVLVGTTAVVGWWHLSLRWASELICVDGRGWRASFGELWWAPERG